MIKFGPSGNSIAFTESGREKTSQSAEWVKNMGLDCFEYSFGRGVNLKEEKAIYLGKVFKENNIEISVHAPYYINLANTDDEMIKKSYGYIMESAKMCELMGGHRIVFHPASQGKLAREDAVALTKKHIIELKSIIEDKGQTNLMFCPETMGKLAQIGTIEEIVSFCELADFFVPCVDFGHVNAREQGSLKTTEDYYTRLKYMVDKLGYEKMKNFHVHFSKIEYSDKGEVRHLTFEDNVYGPEFSPLATALKELKLEPYIVSESAGTQDIDALTMKNIYFGKC